MDNDHLRTALRHTELAIEAIDRHTEHGPVNDMRSVLAGTNSLLAARQSMIVEQNRIRRRKIVEARNS